MKKILFLLILLSVNLSAGIYVSQSGSNTSPYDTWAKATSSFSTAISQASAGDTVFISGGVDSVGYTSQLNINKGGTSGNYLYVMAGKYSPSPSGHSGRAIIRNSGGAGLLIDAVGGTYRQWIYVKGLEFRDCGGEGARLIYDIKHIVIDSCTFIDNWGMGIFLAGNDDVSLADTNLITVDVEIKYCTIISLYDGNVVDDNIQLKYNNDVKIHHNYLRQRNIQSWVVGCADPHHVDNIQVAFGAANVHIYNNICIVDSAANGHCMILGIASSTSDHHDSTLVYNNFMYNGGGDMADECACRYHQIFYLRGSENQGSQYIPKVYVINNTEVVAGLGVLAMYDHYGSIDINNIVYHEGENGSAPHRCDFADWNSAYNGAAIQYKYIDSCRNNLFWRDFGNNEPTFGNNTWIAAGTSTPTSITNLADFINKGGTLVNGNPDFVNSFYPDISMDRSINWSIGELENTSPAIDAGTDVTYIIDGLFGHLPDISTNDITNNPRDSNWDIGSFEFQQGIADTTATVTFTPVTNAELNSYHIASGVLSGADSTFHIWTVTSDSFKVGALSSFDIIMVEAEAGDTVFIPNVASSSYSTQNINYIVVSGTSRSFSVTTKAEAVMGTRTKLFLKK